MQGVTIRPTVHDANFIYQYNRLSNSFIDLAQTVCPKEYNQYSELLGSLFGPKFESITISASLNSFVKSVIEVYNRHYHLQIRPDDVWFAVEGREVSQ